MANSTLQLETLEEAFEFILENIGDASFYDAISLGDWAKTIVYLPDKDIHSSITPQYMEAFLEIQRYILQFSVLIATGSSTDVRYLSSDDRAKLQLNIRVSGGSAVFEADWSKKLNKWVNSMIGKMDGSQTLKLLLGVAILLSASWCFNAWLQASRDVKLEETRSKPLREALQTLQFTTKEETERFKAIMKMLEDSGVLGKAAANLVEKSNSSLLKAASKTEQSVINGVPLNSSQANILRQSERKTPTIRYVVMKAQIIDINTGNPEEEKMIVREVGTSTEHRMTLPNDLTLLEDRKRIFAALDSKEELWVELALGITDDEVKAAQFLRLTSDPGSKK
jgi:hypothetical protein